jgi:7,8-dihydropterin-6-yl-methyl-4-(beta-D-ribofuranosyl)aminobenzene 5'-phosphate synthase
MSDTICVTALVDNSVLGLDLLAEHGLAFCIRTGRHRLLFDTGQSDLVLKNARALEVGLEDLEAIVLSHGHHDHTGGLRPVGGCAPKARLYLHPAALKPKFAVDADDSDCESWPVGMAEADVQFIHQSADSVVWTTKPTEIVDGIFVTGEIPRRTNFEDTGGRFFVDEGCNQPDPLMDDQALFFDTREGLVVIAGCAHAGVVNTVDYIRQISGGRPICAIMGGLHLLNASETRMKLTLAAFRRWDVRRIAAGHCTGLAAVTQMWASFPGRCSDWATGSSMIFHKKQLSPFDDHRSEQQSRFGPGQNLSPLSGVPGCAEEASRRGILAGTPGGKRRVSILSRIRAGFRAQAP